MAQTAVGICNLALLRVGSKQPIGALTESSAAAKSCAAAYPILRDELLEAFPWAFTKAEATLTLLSDVERVEWTYVYSLPADFLLARFLFGAGRNPSSDMRIPYELLADEEKDGLVLATDFADAQLAYRCRPAADAALFSGTFADALAWRLAMDLALGLPVKPQLGLALERKAAAALAKAIAVEANQQGQADPTPDSETIRVRGATFNPLVESWRWR